MNVSEILGHMRSLLLCAFCCAAVVAGGPAFARGFVKLPEAADELTRRLAVFFDFDSDSCYPSPAISRDEAGSFSVNGGFSVTEIDPTFVSGCHEQGQIENANTYYRRAWIARDGVTYSVRMYALYFVKDKSLPLNQPEGPGGHRHDWEFALLWTTNDKVTHAYVSQHQGGELRPVSELYFDAWCPECVKVVYHKHAASTHAMRFAKKNEKAENYTGFWVQPPIVDWWLMPAGYRAALNRANFGEADCSVCDAHFPSAIGKHTPTGYPKGEDWIKAAKGIP